jgi:hypothetical protein
MHGTVNIKSCSFVLTKFKYGPNSAFINVDKLWVAGRGLQYMKNIFYRSEGACEDCT